MNASELRAKAWESLRGNYWPAVLAGLVAACFGATVATGAVNVNVDAERIQNIFGSVPVILKIYLAVVASIGSIIGFAAFILGGTVQIGYAQYLLKQQDREILSIRDLFSQFDRFGQGFLQMLLRNIYIFLWSLLLIVPGIVKSFAYAMTPFIMAENPEMSAKEAIAASVQVMKGHKWELFCLSFSFIGWNILAALSGGIGTIFLNPYINAAFAAFYREKISPKIAVTAYAEGTPVLDMPV